MSPQTAGQTQLVPGLKHNNSCTCVVNSTLWAFPAVKFEAVAQQVESCEASLSTVQQQVRNQVFWCVLVIEQHFQKHLLAGFLVPPTPPSVSGCSPEHHSPTAAPPVPSAPGPVLILSAAPTGPRAQPAEEQSWPNPQPDEQHKNTGNI